MGTTNQQDKTPFWHVNRRQAICVAMVFFLAVGMLSGIFINVQRDLPSLAQLESYRPSLITRIYSADNQILKEFYVQRRVVVPLNKIPPDLIHAVIDMEDRRFWDHWGVSMRDIFRALWIDLKALRTVQGASTLTQQLARNLFLTPEQTVNRKLKEMLVAVRIEKTYSKEEILALYLNQQYLGHGAYGAESAARLFFNKGVEDLNVAECATIAGLLKAPSSYSPFDHPNKALYRRNLVLDAMAECGDISQTDADSLKKTPLALNPQPGSEGEAPYFVEYVRQWIEDTFGSDMLYIDGVSVYTTLDLRYQRLANKAMDRLLREHQQRFPSYQAKGRIVQGALLAIDPASGQIKAMVGGRDFKESQFNRAVQAPRQPGSAFKPFVYTAAIDNGYTPISEMLDQPLVIIQNDRKEWRPKNYDGSLGGPTTLRDGLRLSRNLVTIRLLQKIGAEQVVFYAHRMGIRTPLRPYPSLALGTSEVTVLDLTAAFAVFPNNGIWVRPISIVRIADRNGDEPDSFRRVLQQEKKAKEALNPRTAYVMTNMLQTVVDRGTGNRARQEGFSLPAGGKTGTTDDYTDAWFVGFTPQLAATVWVGFDDPQYALGHGQSGSVAALPAWTQFMKGLQDHRLITAEDFEVPDGIVRARICADSKLLATQYCPRLTNEGQAEVFIAGTEPTESCPLHRSFLFEDSNETTPQTERKRDRLRF